MDGNPSGIALETPYDREPGGKLVAISLLVGYHSSDEHACIQQSVVEGHTLIMIFVEYRIRLPPDWTRFRWSFRFGS